MADHMYLHTSTSVWMHGHTIELQIDYLTCLIYQPPHSSLSYSSPNPQTTYQLYASNIDTHKSLLEQPILTFFLYV